MIEIVDHPFLIFLVFLFVQWGAAYIGDIFRRRRSPGKNEREDFDTVLTATLTLLALIIGFSFSMAVSRYDQRKNFAIELMERVWLAGINAIRFIETARVHHAHGRGCVRWHGSYFTTRQPV